MELPSTQWRAAPWPLEEALPSAPVQAAWAPLAGAVEHGFTHFRLRLELLSARIPGPGPAGTWCRIEALGGQALPTLSKKVIRHALDARPGPLFEGR